MMIGASAQKVNARGLASTRATRQHLRPACLQQSCNLARSPSHPPTLPPVPLCRCRSEPESSSDLFSVRGALTSPVSKTPSMHLSSTQSSLDVQPDSKNVDRGLEKGGPFPHPSLPPQKLRQSLDVVTVKSSKYEVPRNAPHAGGNQRGNAASWLANLLFVENQAR